MPSSGGAEETGENEAKVIGSTTVMRVFPRRLMIVSSWRPELGRRGGHFRRNMRLRRGAFRQNVYGVAGESIARQSTPARDRETKCQSMR